MTIPSESVDVFDLDKGTFTRYDLSGQFCSRSVINLSFSAIGSLKLLQNNINSTT